MFPSDPLLQQTTGTAPSELFDRLGEFWQRLTDADTLGVHQFAKLQMHSDVYLEYLHAVSAMSIQTLPAGSQRQWQALELLESDLDSGPNLVTYGSGYTYGGEIVYGQAEDNQFSWVVPANLLEIGLIMDHVVEPTVVMGPDVFSFDAERSTLTFRIDPFDLIPSETVYDDQGTAIDRRLLLWVRNSLIDRNAPYLRYGAVVGIAGQSSPAYVSVLQAVWSLLLQGPSVDGLWRGLLATAGLDYVRGDETVERVESDGQYLWMVTDRSTYRAHAAATPLVSPGQVLEAGQAWVTTVQQGSVSLLPGLIADGLAFPNQDEQWTYTTDDQGRPDARFTVVGDPQEVEAFWTAVRDRGEADGRYVGEYVGVTAPGAQASVNPAEFISQQLLGRNIIVVSIRPEEFLVTQAGFVQAVRRLIPAGTLLVVHIALTELVDNFDTTTTGESLEVAPAVAFSDQVLWWDGAGARPADAAVVDYPPRVTNA